MKGGQNLTTSILVRPPAPTPTRPMKRQKQVPNEFYLDVGDAIGVIQKWEDGDHSHLWSKSPIQVITELLLTSELIIPYHDAMRVLNSARTTKMRGDANAGMQHIRDEWMRLKKRVEYQE